MFSLLAESQVRACPDRKKCVAVFKSYTLLRCMNIAHGVNSEVYR